MRTTKVYLNYSEAVKRNSIVDIKEYYKQYDADNDKQELLKGSPLIINVEGTYIYYEDIPYLVDKKMKLFAIAIHDQEKHIEYLWRRDNKGRVK